MTTEIGILLKAVDEASAVLSGAADKIKGSMGGVEEANTKLDAAQKRTEFSTKDLAVGFSGVATAGFSLFMTIDRVEKSQFALEKANLAVTRSNEAVDQAQKNYNVALEKFGANSAQAKDAADKLSIAQQANTLASEKASMAQGNVNQAMIQGALTVIPSVITMVSSLSSVRGILESVTSAGAVAEGVAATATAAAAGPTTALTGASWALNASLLANPLVWIVIAIAAFVAALYLAYTYCEPFRNAIDGIGAALKDNLGKAVEVIGTALTWLWNNVLVPVGNFIGAVLTAYINVLGAAFTWLYNNAVKPLGEALSWLWNNVLVPLGNFLYAVFIAELQALGAAFNWLVGVLQPVIDTIMGFFNAVNGALSAVGNAVSGFCSWIGGVVYGSAMGIVDTVASMTGQSDALTEAWAAKSVADVDAAMNSQLQAVTDSYNQQTAAIDAALQTQLTQIDDFYVQQQADAKTAFDAQYAEFLAFYQAQLEPAQETELQKLIDKWTEHFDTQISDMSDAYNQQISDTNAFYDELIDAANEKLSAIRDARKEDLDDLELNMLLEKEALEAAHDAGALSTEDYNKAIKDIEKTYNDSRKGLNDDYRLKELQAEKDIKTETETINTERAAKVEEITTTHNANLTAKEQEKSDKLAEIDAADKKLREDYATTVAALEQGKAKETKDAVEAAELAKKHATESYETQTKAIVETGEAEKARLIKESQDKIAADTGTWSDGLTNAWSGLTAGIGNSWQGLCDGLGTWWSGASSAISTSVGGFCDGVKDWFSGLSAAITGGSIWPNMLESMTEQATTGLGAITEEFTKFKDKLVGQFELVKAGADENLPEVASQFNAAFDAGMFDAAASVVQAFANEYGLSFDQAEQIINKFTDEEKKAFDKQTAEAQKAVDAQIAAHQKLRDAMLDHAEKLKSDYFDRVTSQSESFMASVDALASGMVASWDRMGGATLGQSLSMSLAIQKFADQWGLSWEEARSIVTDAATGIDAEMAKIPLSIEQQLIGKAQADFETFKDCLTGKSASLASIASADVAGMARNITDLISSGLVGEAQAEMQAFVDCNTSKTATMVTDITGMMKKLTTDYNAQLALMTVEADRLTGAQKIAVLRNIDALTVGYEAKMAQLRGWQNQLLTSMVSDVDSALASINAHMAGVSGRADVLMSKLMAAKLLSAEEADRIASALAAKTAGGAIPSGAASTAPGPESIGLKLDELGRWFEEVGGRKTFWSPGEIAKMFPGYGEGGIVESPTLAMLGERGREAVVPLDRDTLMRAIGGSERPIVSIQITGPLVVVEGSADRATAELAAVLVEERLRSVIVEATSSGAPSTSKMIRIGNRVMM